MHLLPSRGRPESLAEFFSVSAPHERGVVILDADDAAQYVRGVILPPGWEWLVTDGRGVVRALNAGFEAFPHEPWYSLLGDDMRCRPVGWDTELAQLAGRNRIATGDDLINGESAAAVPFVGGDLVRAAGWFAYPELGHLYCDRIWHELGERLGIRTHRHDIITEHLHWSTGKMPKDRTALERRTAGDRETFEAFMLSGFEQLVGGLRERAA